MSQQNVYRNHLSKEILNPKDSYVYYITSDNNIIADDLVARWCPDKNKVLSNTYENNIGCIKYKRKVKRLYIHKSATNGKLTDLILPRSVESFGATLLDTLIYINLPIKLKTLTGEAFLRCINLEIDLEEWTNQLTQYSGRSFSYAYKAYGKFVLKSGAKIYPEDTRESSLACRTSCSHVYMESGFTYKLPMPHNPFGYSTQLTSIIVEEGNPNFYSYNDKAMYEKGTNKLVSVVADSNDIWIDGISDMRTHMFAGLTLVDDFAIPDTITTLPSHCFESATLNANFTYPANLSAIGTQCFQYANPNTDNWIMPAVEEYPEQAFYYFQWKQINVVVPEGVKRIGWACFYGNMYSARHIYLPSTIEEMQDSAFGFRYVTIYAVTPPTIKASTFVNSVVEIYVPAESLEAYKTAEYWTKWASRIYAISE